MNAAFPYILATLSFLIPLIAILWLFIARSYDFFVWTMKVLACFAWFLAAFLAAPWALTSIYVKYIFLVIFLVVLVFSFKRVRNKRFFCRKSFSQYLGYMYVVIGLGLGILLNIFIVSSYYYSGPAFSIQSPLRGGTYYIMQGGNSGLTNFFHRFFKHGQYRHALDIVKLNGLGTRASGIAPAALYAYHIYGDTVYSPCHGIVAEVLDTVSDNKIGVLRYDETSGNYVLINCNGTFVALGHLLAGSIIINTNDSVIAGEVIGQIGNSGFSIEPHLHLHAYMIDEKGNELSIPLLIDGRYYSINQKFRHVKPLE